MSRRRLGQTEPIAMGIARDITRKYLYVDTLPSRQDRRHAKAARIRKMSFEITDVPPYPLPQRSQVGKQAP
jgi:hypothetical protein